MNSVDVINTHTTPVAPKKTLHFNVGEDAVELVAKNGKKVISETIELNTLKTDKKSEKILNFIAKAKSNGFGSQNLTEYAANIRKFAAINGYLRKV